MTWRDIDITLDKQHDSDIKSSIHIDAIINSISNIFKTMQGSRRMVPSFAMPTYNLLFEQIDDNTLRNLKEMLVQAISQWEDRIYVEGLEVLADSDNNKIDIILQFRLKNDTNDKIYNINETLITHY